MSPEGKALKVLRSGNGCGPSHEVLVLGSTAQHLVKRTAAGQENANFAEPRALSLLLLPRLTKSLVKTGPQLLGHDVARKING